MRRFSFYAAVSTLAMASAYFVASADASVAPDCPISLSNYATTACFELNWEHPLLDQHLSWNAVARLALLRREPVLRLPGLRLPRHRVVAGDT